MNFHKLYQIINENTISQELKKFDKEKLKKLSSKTEVEVNGYFPNLNTKSKNIFTKWFLFTLFHVLETYEHDNYRIIGPWVSQLRDEVGDFIAHNTDDHGNLNAQLASKFNNPNFSIDDLRVLNHEYHHALAQGAITRPGAKGKNILTFNDGYSWVDLEKGYCDKEGRSMGHCGNINAQQGDTILSLRDRKNVPHLTFVLNNGYLIEMKGKGNSKPAQGYHKYIVELLKLPIIKNIMDGRYLVENDFKLSDLTNEQREEVFNVNPKLKIRYTYEKLKYNQNLSKEEFDELEKFALDKWRNNFHERQKIKVNLAKNEHTPAEVLTSLFNQSKEDRFHIDDRQILRYIAGNPNTSKEVLIGLVKINNLEIKKTLADNDNSPLEVLEILADDDSVGVRMKTAMNANASKELLTKLRHDKDPDVRNTASIYLNS